MKANKGWSDARHACISERTLARVRAQLGIRSRKSGMGKGQHWVWVLPESAKYEPNTANNEAKAAKYENLAAFEENTETTPVNSPTSPKAAKVEKYGSLRSDDGSLRSETPDVLDHLEGVGDSEQPAGAEKPEGADSLFPDDDEGEIEL